MENMLCVNSCPYEEFLRAYLSEKLGYLLKKRRKRCILHSLMMKNGHMNWPMIEIFTTKSQHSSN
jgi:hypothetical protein